MTSSTPEKFALPSYIRPAPGRTDPRKPLVLRVDSFLSTPLPIGSKSSAIDSEAMRCEQYKRQQALIGTIPVDARVIAVVR